MVFIGTDYYIEKQSYSYNRITAQNSNVIQLIPAPKLNTSNTNSTKLIPMNAQIISQLYSLTTLLKPNRVSGT